MAEIKRFNFNEVAADLGYVAESGPGGPGGPGHRPMGQAPAPVYETRILTCDSVVVSGGRTPRDPGAIAACAPIFKKIGDSVNVADIPPATYSGYKAAMEL